MRKIAAFFKGMSEFRSDVTTGYADLGEMDAYDAGRDLAHRLTLRYFD